MYTGKMDLLSLALYVAMGIFAAACMWLARKDFGSLRVGERFSIQKRYLAYALFVAVFTFLATFRAIGPKLGGADAENYRQIFLNAWNPESEFYSMISEPLFRWYCQGIRLLTDDYRVFFGISYGLVAASYVLFIEKYCPKAVSAIPFVLLVFPYLKAFCTLRSSLAVALFLLALVPADRNRILSALLVVATVFVHRMSVAYVLLLVFCLIFEKLLRRLEGVKLLGLLCAVGLCGVAAARLVQWIIIQLGLFQGPDAWYLRQSVGQSLFARFPMYFAHLLLLVAMTVLGSRVRQSRNYQTVKLLCSFDIVVMPATVVLGFWRANEYLYVARLIMWAMLIPAGEALFTEYAPKILERIPKLKWKPDAKLLALLFRVGAAGVFLFWLVFRIRSEWDDLKIMPYILNLT